MNYPSRIDEICPETEYTKSHLAEIVFPDGRRLCEALLNHPSAPEHTTKVKAGKYYMGHKLIDFCEKYMSLNFNDMNAALRDEWTKIHEEKMRLNGEAQKNRRLLEEIKAETYLLEKLRSGQANDISSVLMARMRYLPCISVCIKRAMGAGVYFLYKNDDIIYIGQSVNVMARVGQHVDKDFDNVKIICCDKQNLNDVEAFFIDLFKPRLNKIRPISSIRDFSNIADMIHEDAQSTTT